MCLELITLSHVFSTETSACYHGKNILVKAEHIPGKHNLIADSIYRCQWKKFRELAPKFSPVPVQLPTHVWKI